MSSPFQKSFCGKSPLNQSRPANINEPRKKTVIKKQTSLNQVEINQDEADSFSFGPSSAKLGGIQAVADDNRKAAKRKMSQPKSSLNYGSPLEQEENPDRTRYQDSVKTLHKSEHDAYLKRKKEGFSISDDDGQTFNQIAPETNPTKIKNLKEFAYTQEIGKGGSVKDSKGRGASTLARMYR